MENNSVVSATVKFVTVFFGTILASLALITGLAWNSAIEQYLTQHPEFKNRGRWIYAISITVVTVFLTMGFAYAISKFGLKEEYNNTMSFLPNR